MLLFNNLGLVLFFGTVFCSLEQMNKKTHLITKKLFFILKNKK